MPNELINGVAYDFSSIEFSIRGKRFYGITEITYSDSLTPEKVRGASVKIIGMTRGEYDTNGSLTVTKESQIEVIDELGDGYGEVEIDAILVTYANEGQKTITDEIRRVRIVGFEDNPSQGAEGITSSTDITIYEILRNGKRLYKDPDETTTSENTVNLGA